MNRSHPPSGNRSGILPTLKGLPADLAASSMDGCEARPPLTLILGAAGAGKTEWTLAHFLAPPARALLVVSSTAQADTRAEQIAARADRNPADVRPSVFTFHTLAVELTRSCLRDGGKTIGRAFQRLVLADVVRNTLRTDDYFGGMLQAPGFVPALLERIREWKLACLTPDELEAAAQPAAEQLQDPTFARKTGELARLFRAYQTFLTRNRMRDEEDFLHLASKQARSDSVALPGNASRIMVDGFYRFNRAQRELLAALAHRGMDVGRPEVEVAVTLPYDPERSLLFAAPERALCTLRAEFACRETVLSAPATERPTALTALAAGLYGNKPGVQAQKAKGKPGSKESSSPLRSPISPVLLFDAPNPYVEAEMVARAFRRLYDLGGYRWDDFAVVLRTLGDYAPILAAVFERYGIPLGVDGPETLAENPLIKTVLHLLAVVRYGWQRDDVLAFMKSSYTAPNKLLADDLRRRARAAGVRAGRSHWLALIQHDNSPSGVAQTLRDMAQVDALLTDPTLEPSELADGIRSIVALFGLEERIALGEPTRQERDRAALRVALEVLYALAEMFALAVREPTRSRTEPFSFNAFYTELVSAWQSASSIATPDGDMVRVAEPYDTRDRRIKVAAVMGLTERVFPRRITEDPFLRDEERLALRTLAGIDLEAQQCRADDERFLFYLAVTAPTEQLILSYPRASDESDTLPSFYLDEVKAVLEGQDEEYGKWKPRGGGMDEDSPSRTMLVTVSRTLADVAPRFEETVSDSDRLLATCADLFDPSAGVSVRDETFRQAARRMQTFLNETASPAVVRRIVASRGRPRLPRLEASDLLAAFAGDKSVYSVSELETYGRCPFQYLLTHVLDLHPEADGAEARAQGTLLHGVLRRYFRRRSAQAKQQNGMPPSDPAMRDALYELLEEALAHEHLDISVHRQGMVRRLLTDALDGFVEREERFVSQFGMTPAHFELSFGLSAAGAAWIADEDHDGLLGADAEGETVYDPASCAEPLALIAADGGPAVALCGTIDRVDLDATGQRALVLDYKLGKPPEWADIQRGASLQMPLYLLALERLFGKVGAVACYDSMRERGRRRFHRLEHVNLRQFGPLIPLEDGTTVTPLNRDQFSSLVKTAEATAVRLARAISCGNIEATPGDHCRACAYGDICRTTVIGGHDGERPSPTSVSSMELPSDTAV